jgi:predicted site-specific integrase-resolvase
MKLSTYAKQLGISYRCAWDLFDHNQIPGAFQLPTGTIIVPNDHIQNASPNQVLLYARVSSHQQKDDLERQADRLYQFAVAKGYTVYKTVKEIGSGLNDNRQQLNKVLEDKNYNKLIIEHKDRLTRFGFRYIELLFKEQNREIEVINLAEEKTEIMQDFISIITSFCAKIYGHRRCQNKSKKIIKELQDNESN